jgi:hypothetical protein
MQIKQLYSQSGNLKTPVKQKTDKDLKQVKIGDHTVSQIPGLAPGASKVFVFPVLSMAANVYNDDSSSRSQNVQGVSITYRLYGT